MRRMKIPILMYHDICENSPSAMKGRSIHPSYFVSAETFRSQLQSISNLHLLAITLAELSKHHENIDNAKKVILSFDDGYVGNYLCAFPELKAQGMVATFFCAVSLIGKKNMMTWSNLKEMISEGMSVQSHGFSHRPLASLSKEEIYEDLKRSKTELEDNLGERVAYLSLPHGSFNRHVISAAKEIGYEKICTSLIGYNTGDEYLLRRILFRSDDNPQKYEKLITGRYNFLFPKFIEKMKTAIKNSIGHGNYLRLYHYFHKI